MQLLKPSTIHGATSRSIGAGDTLMKSERGPTSYACEALQTDDPFQVRYG